MRHPPTGVYYNMGVLTPLPKPFTPYRFDKSKCTEMMDGIVHQLAWCVAAAEVRSHSTVPSVEEAAAREREAQAWEPAGRYSGC
jgi:hypothetical protein